MRSTGASGPSCSNHVNLHPLTDASPSASTLHDKPPPIFHKRTVADTHELHLRLAQDHALLRQPFGSAQCHAGETLFTTVLNGWRLQLLLCKDVTHSQAR